MTDTHPFQRSVIAAGGKDAVAKEFTEPSQSENTRKFQGFLAYFVGHLQEQQVHPLRLPLHAGRAHSGQDDSGWGTARKLF
jgi:hypothetical protein